MKRLSDALLVVAAVSLITFMAILLSAFARLVIS